MNINDRQLTIRFVVLLGLAWSITGITSSAALAQNSYQQLALRHNRASIYLSTFTLPGPSDDKSYLTATFRINYRMLSFKRLNSADDERFYATPTLRLELFKSPQKNLRSNDKIPLVELTSAGRKTWSDTVYAANYKATKAKTNFAKGFIQMQIAPGYYVSALQFSETGTSRELTARRQTHISNYKKDEEGEIILIEDIKQKNSAKRLKLLNLGDNVYFGENFYALVHLPNFTSEDSYQFKVQKVRITKEDTLQVETVFQDAITNKQLIKKIYPSLTQYDDKLYLKLQHDSHGYRYAIIKIPNSSLPDASYKIEVTRNDQPVAQKTYNTLWFDKPISLYSADLAIKMLHFIVDEQTIEHIGSGSAAEEKKKLNAFWKERDPTPKTAFNELKAEYYGRIDYAYNHFSSPDTPGFKDDRGRIYILYGPPNDIKRVYPSESTAREIWTYSNKRFVFKATSGYGRFKLISN